MLSIIELIQHRSMTPETIHHFVVGTARLSAVLFVLALLGASLGTQAVRLWLAYVAGHTVHFSFVAWLAFATDGANLRDIGGWPTVIWVGTGFYIFVICAALAWAGSGWRAVRVLGHAGVVMIALAFIATYAGLIAKSALFALPVVAILGAVGFYIARVFQASGRMP
jgi:hypothetical protein